MRKYLNWFKDKYTLHALRARAHTGNFGRVTYSDPMYAISILLGHGHVTECREIIPCVYATYVDNRSMRYFAVSYVCKDTKDKFCMIFDQRGEMVADVTTDKYIGNGQYERA